MTEQNDKISNQEDISLMEMSIFRFHVRISGKRTTISLDPNLFRALTYKLGSSATAKKWISEKAVSLAKNNKSISRQIQSSISLFLVDLGSSNQSNQSVISNQMVEKKQAVSAPKAKKPKVSSAPVFKSDDLPL
jgi:hypothetical protein